MNPANIQELVSQGEGLTVEFKECRSALNRDVYETICAFLNATGGIILLGVKDDGTITGVEPDSIEQIKKDLVTSLNNPQKISPTVFLVPDVIEIKDKLVIYLHVPRSSVVHRCNGKIYTRNVDGDFDITNNTHGVANLYLQKQVAFSENRIFPYVELSDLRLDLIQRVQKLAAMETPDHPWAGMKPIELLKSARLHQKDYATGKEGFNLAAVLLLGKDEVIGSVLPHHRTDAILRRVNLDRYDDRDDIRTNLIETYDRLMAFTAKHLPDPFYQEDDIRKSLRSLVFREVISNIIIHREYSNPYPAKFIIEADRVVAENANCPHWHGEINPQSFTPFPKNPIIAKFFKEIRMADELGSGVRNLFKYVRVYSRGGDPRLVEDDVFKAYVPLPGHDGGLSGGKVPEKCRINAGKVPDSIIDITGQEQKVIQYLRANERATSSAVQELLGIGERRARFILNRMVEAGYVKKAGRGRSTFYSL